MTSAPAMLAEDLRFRYGRTEVLRGIGLEVRAGDLYGLLGRNGAGKTTTMRAMLGFLPGARGRSEVLGVPSRRIHTVAQELGVALDPPGLDDTLTVRQNLELACIRGGVRSGRSVDAVLELVRMRHRQHNRGDRLSHGEGRRAAVARALLGDPRLLVLDEPLSGLDPDGVEELLELFRRLCREEGVTIVFSSHHLREVEDYCNRIGLIENGVVVLEGVTEELLEEAGGGGVLLRCREGAAARRFLESHALIQGVTELDGGRLRAQARAGADLAPLLRELAAAPFGLEEFQRQRATLVDVFRRAVS